MNLLLPSEGSPRRFEGSTAPAQPLAPVSVRRLAITILALLAPLPFLTATGYLGSSDLHAAMEVVGAPIGMVAGLTFLLRFRALDDRAHLFFGLAFLANASADVVHGVAPFLVSRGVLSIPEASLADLLPATFIAGRTMAAVLLLAAPTLASRGRRGFSRAYVVRMSLVTMAVGLLVSAAIFALPLPRLLFPSRVIGRPADLLTAVIFAAAAVRLYTWHRRNGDRMTWWVAVSAATGAVGQTWMGFSTHLYDIHFDVAHGYKLAGYLLPLLGLSLYQVRLIAQRERLAADLGRYASQLELANEELEQANAVKTDFVSVVSHELRTPLTAILGFASTMLEFWEDTPDDEKREQMQIIERQGARLGRLINDLLAMSRLESGTLDTYLTDVDLGEVTRRVVADHGDRFPGVEVDIPAGTTVRSDPDHLEQILLNYLANAGKYGRPPIRVTVEDGQPGAVTVVVSDEGDGVPAAFHDQLFEKFAQADSGPTRRSQGTGLGLAIVRGLARAQGGDAWFEPNEPTGSRFIFRLPKARS